MKCLQINNGLCTGFENLIITVICGSCSLEGCPVNTGQVVYVFFSKFPLCINYLMGDLLTPKGKPLGSDGWFPGFLDDSVVLYKIGNMNSVSNLWLLPAKTAFVSAQDCLGGSWMFRCSYHQADNDLGRTGLEHGYRWPFVFSDKLLGRWQGLTSGGSFILPFASAGLIARFSGV